MIWQPLNLVKYSKESCSFEEFCHKYFCGRNVLWMEDNICENFVTKILHVAIQKTLELRILFNFLSTCIKSVFVKYTVVCREKSIERGFQGPGSLWVSHSFPGASRPPWSRLWPEGLRNSCLSLYHPGTDEDGGATAVLGPDPNFWLLRGVPPSTTPRGARGASLCPDQPPPPNCPLGTTRSPRGLPPSGAVHHAQVAGLHWQVA